MSHFKNISVIFLLFFSLTANNATAQVSKQNIVDSIDIIHYDINLNLVYLSQKSISGIANIALLPKISEIHNIYLELLKLNIDSIQINHTATSFTYNDTVIKIPLPSDKIIPVEDTVYVTVYYHGQPIKDASGWGGFYFTADSTYAFNLGVGFIADPHSYGRVWFPCIDDFRDKASYDFKIRVKNTNTAICNGLLIDSYCTGNNTKIFHWKIKTPIPAYLASVAVGKYILISDVYHGIKENIPLTMYVRPADSLKTIASFANLKQILNIYENLFGPYQWEKIGYVGVPFNNGAMEHATNIAYPNLCIDGTLSYESLMAHELSHHWFGNLITCSTEEDMWINEGWATYCESLYKEKLYGNTTFKNDVRTRHKDVLQKAHYTDGNYLALNAIPHNYTYSTTAYDKGADVVHTLRNYIGDSLFFASVTKLLTYYPYTDISSDRLRDSLSTFSGINLNDFFDTWVFNPGFPHFSIDSFKTLPLSNNYQCTVYMRQRLKGTNNFANNNKIEITFFDKNWNKFTDTFYFSGKYDLNTFIVPFNPDFVIVDLEEKIADATVDNYKTITTTGIQNFNDTYFILETTNISDSAFIRVENSWVAPDPFKNPQNCMVLSNHRYWKIDGIIPDNFTAKGKFYYSKLNHLDDELITTPIDSLLILYRKNTADDWHLIPFTRNGTSTSGYLIVDAIHTGEYVLGVKSCNHPLEINENINKENLNFVVYPNPSENCFNFTFNNTLPLTLNIFNTYGKLVSQIEVPAQQGMAKWYTNNQPSGNYFVVLQQKTGKVIGRSKIVLTK